MKIEERKEIKRGREMKSKEFSLSVLKYHGTLGTYGNIGTCGAILGRS